MLPPFFDDQSPVSVADVLTAEVVARGSRTVGASLHRLDDGGVGTSGVVFVDTLGGTGVAAFHDGLDERVEVNLKAGVPAFLGVDGLLGSVRGVVGVQSVGRLPLIRNAVVVAIEASRAGGRFQGVGTLILHEVDDALAMGDGLAVARLGG